MTPTADQLAALSQRFVRFAERECRGASALYERLSLGIAEDADLLAIASHARPGQPAPNLFLAAVHLLLLQGIQHPLADYYASLSGTATGDAIPSFRDFCLEHAGAIKATIATRIVQTNEVRRCTALLPAFGLVARCGGGKPLFLVDVGASAGLNLLCDSYGYRYSNGQRTGNPDAPLQLECALQGAEALPLPKTMPQVGARIGIDLSPVDLRDPQAVLWLRALVWPDETGRMERLQQAIAIAHQHPPTLLAGDALDLLPEVLAAAPLDETVCVYHCHTLNQFSQEARNRFERVLSEASLGRIVYRLSLEAYERTRPALELITYRGGKGQKETLGFTASGHVEWLQWVGGQAE